MYLSGLHLYTEPAWGGVGEAVIGPNLQTLWTWVHNRVLLEWTSTLFQDGCREVVAIAVYVGTGGEPLK